VVAPLSATHRCIVPNWPLGSHRIPLRSDFALDPESLAGIVADFLAALELEDVTLVGNDSGGAVCQIVCANHPERIGRLVLTSCDAFEVFPPEGFEYLSLVARIPGLAWMMMRAMLHIPALRRIKRAYGLAARRPIPDHILRGWVEPAATNRRVRADMKKLARTVSNRYTLEAADKLRDFDKPVLLLWAADDRWFFPAELGERLRDLFPNARLEMVEDCYVFVPEDQPELVAARIEDFVERGNLERRPAAA
jgi:pimeloyl-ACP methyl ester carboxylesterase